MQRRDEFRRGIAAASLALDVRLPIIALICQGVPSRALDASETIICRDAGQGSYARVAAGELELNAEAWTILAVGTALGGLMWQMLRSLRHDMVRRFGDVDRRFGDVDRRFDDVDRRFDDVAENFRDVRNRLDRLAADHRGLADDHHGLARELSELRGELRGRLDERARPEAG